MLRIALTGGIASGKSTVAGLFASLGAKLIDTDQVAREIVVPGSPALERLAVRFGKDVLQPDGTLDRAKLRHLVFSDDAARADLESIMHPAIRARVAELSAVLSATTDGPYQLISVPLLVETSTQKDYDRVLVVDCDPDVQLRRVVTRGLEVDEARKMIRAQASREARLAIADDVIVNNSDIRTLASQVQSLHDRYLAL